MLLVVGALIPLFGWWREIILKKTHTKLKKIVLYTTSVVIIMIGLINIITFVKTTQASNQLRSERLILTDLKIKFEIQCSVNQNPNVGHIIGAPLKLQVYSKKDTLLTPFYLTSPIDWDIIKLPSDQIKANIFFSADPEMPFIGKRIIQLERYDAIKYPLGLIAKSLNLTKTSQIIKIVEAIYVNGIAIRRVEMPIELSWGNSDMLIKNTTINEWYSRPFRSCEKEYLLALKKSSKNR